MTAQNPVPQYEPRSAAAWTNELKSLELPSPFNVVSRLVKALRNDNNSYDKLAGLISTDPVLAFRVISSANQLADQKEESSKHVAHAISVIGIDSLDHLAKSMISQERDENNLAMSAYQAVILRSLLAAELAKAICEIKAPQHANDCYWSALFYAVPEWYLWRYAPQEVANARHQVASRKSTYDQASTTFLGCTAAEISEALAEHLIMPATVRKAWQTQHQPSKRQYVRLSRHVLNAKITQVIEDRDLALLKQEPHFIVILANQIASCAEASWHAKSTKRMLKVLAAVLSKPFHEITQLVHKIAVDVSRSHPVPGTLSFAARLFFKPSENTLLALKDFSGDLNALNAKETHNYFGSTDLRTLDAMDVQTQDNNRYDTEDDGAEEDMAIDQSQAMGIPEALAPDQGDRKLYERNLMRMNENPESFRDLHELMNIAAQSIGHGMGVSRCFIMLANKNQDKLKTYYQVGCDDYQDLANLGISIVPKDIFGKLLDKPASIWVKPGSSAKVVTLIPGEFKEKIKVDDFFMMSIFLGKKAIGLVYTDNLGGETLGDQHYSEFKDVCGGVAHVLKELAQRKQNGNA